MLNLQSNSGASYIRFMAQTKTWENSSKEVITLDTMVRDLDVCPVRGASEKDVGPQFSPLLVCPVRGASEYSKT